MIQEPPGEKKLPFQRLVKKYVYFKQCRPVAQRCFVSPPHHLDARFKTRYEMREVSCRPGRLIKTTLIKKLPFWR